MRLTKQISLEDAVFKLTGRVAKRLGLKTRGVIEVDKSADLVIFDPQTVGSTADFQNPYALATGVISVIVNGQIAFDGNKVTHAGSGRALRFGAS